MGAALATTISAVVDRPKRPALTQASLLGCPNTSNGPVTTPPPALVREEGASRINGLLTAQPSPTAVPQPFLNVDGGVVIAIQHESAVRTRMDANAERLRHELTATAAQLRCTARIHLDVLATGALSLAREYRDELRPPGVVNVLGQHPASQPFDVEVLHRDGEAARGWTR